MHELCKEGNSLDKLAGYSCAKTKSKAAKRQHTGNKHASEVFVDEYALKARTTSPRQVGTDST